MVDAGNKSDDNDDDNDKLDMSQLMTDQSDS